MELFYSRRRSRSPERDYYLNGLEKEQEETSDKSPYQIVDFPEDVQKVQSEAISSISREWKPKITIWCQTQALLICSKGMKRLTEHRKQEQSEKDYD